ANVVASATTVTHNTAADNEDATTNTSAVDAAYMPSTKPIRGEPMVALPALADPEAKLVLTSAQDAEVSITPVDSIGKRGEPFTQELAADTAVTDNKDADSYLLATGTNNVHAGVMIDSSAGISTLPVNTVSETGSGLPVRVCY